MAVVILLGVVSFVVVFFAIRSFQNLGYGSCKRCNKTWNRVESFIIPYTSGNGMFPLCKNCFGECSVVEVRTYSDLLIDSRTEHRRPLPYVDGMSLDELRQRVYAAIEYIKNERDEAPFPSPDWVLMEKMTMEEHQEFSDSFEGFATPQ